MYRFSIYRFPPLQKPGISGAVANTCILSMPQIGKEAGLHERVRRTLVELSRTTNQMHVHGRDTDYHASFYSDTMTCV